jgi:hypothetical protein
MEINGRSQATGANNAPMSVGPVPSPYTTTLIAVITVFLLLATIAVGIRLYAVRKSTPSGWLTKDIYLIIAALVVAYGSVISNIIGAALVGLDFVGTRLSIEDASKVTFQVQKQRAIYMTSTEFHETDLLFGNDDYNNCQRACQSFHFGVLQAYLYHQKLQADLRFFHLPCIGLDDWYILCQCSFPFFL